jgi:hypothetical protein
MKKLTITARILPDGKAVTVVGRDAWHFAILSTLAPSGARRSTIPARDGVITCSSFVVSAS